MKATVKNLFEALGLISEILILMALYNVTMVLFSLC